MLELFTSPICFSLFELIMFYVAAQLITETASFISGMISAFKHKK
jgi:hypothetical protein